MKAAFWVAVASIGKGMYIDFLQVFGLAKCSNGFEVAYMAVYAAIAYQSQQVKGFVAIPCMDADAPASDHQ